MRVQPGHVCVHVCMQGFVWAEAPGLGSVGAAVMPQGQPHGPAAWSQEVPVGLGALAPELGTPHVHFSPPEVPSSVSFVLKTQGPCI